MPRPLSFREIEAFRAVMQAGTTTAAAQLLHTTQPSVSRLLAQMQAGAGLKLFDMHKGRLRPTPEALELFATVQQHFVGLERIERDLQGLRLSGAGTLRIGCTPALGLSVLPAVVHAFAQQHPSTPLSLQTLGTSHLREGLQLGQFDLVVSTMAIEAPDLSASVLHRSQAVCVMHPGHTLAQREELHVSDLADQLLLTLNADDNIFLQLQQTMQRHGVQARSTIETTYSSTICCLAAEGTGIGVVNPYVASKFAAELAIRPLLPQCAVEIALALPLHRAPSARADVFVQLLQQHLQTGKGPG
ncbi:MAG: LysR substrate-binding domain-containing protein [Comamonas sp.]|uniref:LysR substrate-binding domain-containing protein n=1 Tax=Comamonas sp. TaxID=34028 RepID=UPI002FCA8FB7